LSWPTPNSIDISDSTVVHELVLGPTKTSGTEELSIEFRYLDETHRGTQHKVEFTLFDAALGGTEIDSDTNRVGLDGSHFEAGVYDSDVSDLEAVLADIYQL